MRLNSNAKRCAGAGALSFALMLAAPAFAHGDHMPPMGPPPRADMPMPPMSGPAMAPPPGVAEGPPPGIQVDPRARAAWLEECRHRIYRHDDAWFHHGRHHERDWDEYRDGDYDYCEAYFDDYYAYYARGGYAYGVYGYAQAVPMAPPMMMVPVRRQVQNPDCVREVVSEDVPVRRRVIYRPHRVHDKRVRIAPDKRVPAN